MKKQLKETTIYQPNDFVKVTVVNNPAVNEKTGEIFYKSTVTLRVENAYSADKLIFTDDESISDFLSEIDLEDPQQSLPLRSAEGVGE